MFVANSDNAMEAIDLIACMASTNEKKEALATHPQLKTIVLYAYNPYVRFYIAKFPRSVKGRGDNVFSKITWDLLNNLADRTLSGNAGKTIVFDYIRSLTPRSGALMKLIITKDFKWGMGAKTINEVWPEHIPQHNILLAEDLTPDKLNLPCYVSPKVDGLRATYIDGEFYTRMGKPYESLSTYRRVVEPYFKSIAPGLDGEMVVLGARNFDELSGELRSKRDQLKAHFFIFDILMPERPFSDRLQVLNAISVPEGRCTIIPHLTIYDMEGIRDYFKMCVSRGFEGIVLKTFNHMYHGKRSYDWMRLVTEHMGDGVLIDVEEGTGKNAGGVGALIINYKGQDLRIAAGKLDYEQRKVMWDEPEIFVGSILQFCYKGRTSKGNLRQPRFERWREDKM